MPFIVLKNIYKRCFSPFLNKVITVYFRSLIQMFYVLMQTYLLTNCVQCAPVPSAKKRYINISKE